MSEKTEKKQQKNALNRIALQAGMFYVIGQMMIRGLTFLTTPIYTRLVSTAQYGQIRVYESWLLIMVPVMSLCLWRSVDRAKYDTGEDYNSYVSSAQSLSYMSIAVFFLLALLFHKPVMAFCGMNTFMFFMAFLYVFAYTSILFFQRREKQMMRYKASILITTITIVPATLLSIAMLYWGNKTGRVDSLVDYRVFGFYLPQVIGGLIVGIVLFVQGRKLIHTYYWKYALKYSLPLIPEALSIQIMNQADKIMIQFLVGNEYTGIFALGTTISFIIWVVEDSVWNAFLPWMYEKIERQEAEDIQKPWLLLMHTFELISWGLVAVAPEIVAVLGPKSYQIAIYLVAPMVTGTLLRFYSYIYTAIENYYKKTTYVAVGTIVTMIINVFLNYICILKFGYMAAAYTTAVSYFILVVIQGLLEKKVAGDTILPLGKCCILAGIYFVINVASMVLYQVKWYLRYGVILVVVLMAAKFMLPQLLKLLKNLKKK